MKIAERLCGKDILIWGYGREGKSTENFIKDHCSVKSLTVFEGKREEIDESRYDYIIKSPGIYVENYGANYTSQTELFFEEFASQTIGITGTKGKSTTASLLYHTLRGCIGDNVILCGNIGLPCLDYYDSIDSETVIVFEMSCHQLNNLKYSPHIGVFLNLYEDHLDYYKTREGYFATKINITAHQKSDDYFFYGNDVPDIDTAAVKQLVSFDSPLRFRLKLMGEHNQFNARFVYLICTQLFGCSDADVRKYMEEFTGLHHRLELVAEVNGVRYYNDSISTIPEATIKAIGSIPDVKTVIIGGMDRHIHYDILTEFIKNHGEYNYILSYASGRRISESLPESANIFVTEDLASSVKLAKEITPAGSACLFSPAAASYGYFKNFEERGDAYTRLVTM